MKYQYIKQDWIIKYIKNSIYKTVNILDPDFVDAYIVTFDVSYIPTNFGALKCYELEKLLLVMYKYNLLDRIMINIIEGQFGFSNCVYNYCLKRGKNNVKNNTTNDGCKSNKGRNR